MANRNTHQSALRGDPRVRAVSQKKLQNGKLRVIFEIDTATPPRTAGKLLASWASPLLFPYSGFLQGRLAESKLDEEIIEEMFSPMLKGRRARTQGETIIALRNRGIDVPLRRVKKARERVSPAYLAQRFGSESV